MEERYTNYGCVKKAYIFPKVKQNFSKVQNIQKLHFTTLSHLDRCIENKEPILEGKGVCASSEEGPGAHPPDEASAVHLENPLDGTHRPGS